MFSDGGFIGLFVVLTTDFYGGSFCTTDVPDRESANGLEDESEETHDVPLDRNDDESDDGDEGPFD
jgi:hypothetical protein